MTYTIYRTEKNLSETIIGVAYDMAEACILMENDRDNIDWDAGYRFETEEYMGKKKKTIIANGKEVTIHSDSCNCNACKYRKAVHLT